MMEKGVMKDEEECFGFPKNEAGEAKSGMVDEL